MGEFDLIERYFKAPTQAMKLNQFATETIALGIGDDCALLQTTPGMQLAISNDMLVEGRHFLPSVDPYKLGHKALAVNLSDLAACGAKPVAFTLALALPKVDEAWLAPFSRGLLTLAAEHHCTLIGGDTTQGPLNICITVFGEVPKNAALLRSGAQIGDDIYVSGTVGDARLALEMFRGNIQLPDAAFAIARARMETPTPRVQLGMALRGIANSAIDVSDGLLGDLSHILRQSGVGAQIDTSIVASLFALNLNTIGLNLNSSNTIKSIANYQDSKSFHSLFSILQIDQKKQLEYSLAGGDDYELVFTAPVALRDALQTAASISKTPVTRIGSIQADLGLRLIDEQGQQLPNTFSAFDHFKSN